VANWYGTARSNYVRIKDMDGLKKALGPFDIKVVAKDNSDPNLVCFLSVDADSGGWPGFGYVEAENEETGAGDEVEFDPAAHICPFMADGEILVMMEAGAEKLRYVTGSAQAYNSKGEVVYLNLDRIYKLAAKKFKADLSKISLCEY